MPFFNIDDRKIKQIIKDAVGAKEGDFNGQKMMCGTTVNPVVVINNYNLQKVAYMNDAITQNIWYTILDDVNVMVNGIHIIQAVANEDLELRITINNGIEDVIWTGNQTAVAATPYEIVFDPTVVQAVNFSATITSYYRSFLFESSHVKIEIRKTSNAGANNTGIWVHWHKR